MVQTKPLAPPSAEATIPARASVVDALILHVLAVLCWVAWLVPWPVWHVASSATGLAAMCFRQRRVVLANVRHARAGVPTSIVVAWYLGAQQIATHCKTVIGTLQAGARQLDPEDHLLVEGVEHIAPFLGERGIIIVAPHAGPYPTLGMMASHWLRGRGFGGELVVVARLFRPFRSGALMDWFIGCFARSGAEIVSVDESPRRLGTRLRRVLEANGIVVLLVDEPTPTPSVSVPFFDSEVRLPLGPVRLAQATGSVIIPCIATYGRSRRVTMTIVEPIEPSASATDTVSRIASSLQPLVERHLDQWAMLTPIWQDTTPPPGHSYADLHLHTVGSDGFCLVDEWLVAAKRNAVSVIAVTDHDHVATIRDWKIGADTRGGAVLPGVELTARGRIVHLGVLFGGEVPETLPPPGRPLGELVRWARTIPGSVVVLVHPLPLLWRWQLRGLARDGALPDAIETRFPFPCGEWRSGGLERAARSYNLATVGGSDAHLGPEQLGQHVTIFPGESVDDLVAALRARTTRSATRAVGSRPALATYARQSLYSWLFPFRRNARVAALRCRLLRTARERLESEAPGVGDAMPAPERHERVATR